jgi:hypothetical protein
MNVAIDIDGTCSAYPAAFAALSRALTTAACRVVLLTGHSCSEPSKADQAALLASRRRQVEPWGLSFEQIIVRVGRNSAEVADQKASYCRASQVCLFIDDSPDYCRAVKRLAPSTLVLRVWEDVR